MSAVGVLAAAMPVSAISAAEAAKQPNIIYIMADDMGYGNLGCFGSTTIQTPHIDRMCAEGIKFTDCYSGGSVCAPARSTLMTGYHLGHAPVRGNVGTPLFPEDVTVADVLKEAGYVTGGFGKWGLGNQGKQGAAEEHGFDTFFGYYNQVHAHDYYTSHLFRNSERVELEGPAHNVISYGEREKRTGQYSHYAIFDETVKFIKESARSGKPFFCYAPWTPPHSKMDIPEDDPAWALYKDKPWKPAKAKVVAAMDTMVDRQVGEILDLLKELNIDDNTIVFFTSDNGASRHYPGLLDSCGAFKGIKGSMYEGGLRVPMVVRWPGKIKAGSESDLPWYFPDVMATLAELAGVSKEVPKDTDGISVVPTLLGKGDQKKHDYLFWKKAIRMGKWKGVGNPGELALYDLSKDIGEENDLAAKRPEIVAKLTAFMEQAWTEPRSQERDGQDAAN